MEGGEAAVGEGVGGGEVGQGEGVDALDGVGEVGVDLEAVQVAHDEEGRAGEVFAVLEKLLVGRGQVLVLALVLPGEVAPVPDVGVAFPAAGLGDALLEGVEGAALVGGGRVGLAEDFAQVAEVGLGGGAFGEGGGLPTGDEFGQGEGRHGGRIAGVGVFVKGEG